MSVNAFCTSIIIQTKWAKRVHQKKLLGGIFVNYHISVRKQKKKRKEIFGILWPFFRLRIFWILLIWAIKKVQEAFICWKFLLLSDIYEYAWSANACHSFVTLEEWQRSNDNRFLSKLFDLGDLLQPCHPTPKKTLKNSYHSKIGDYRSKSTEFVLNSI